MIRCLLAISLLVASLGVVYCQDAGEEVKNAPKVRVETFPAPLDDPLDLGNHDLQDTMINLGLSGAGGNLLEQVLKADWDRLDYTVALFDNGLQIGGVLVPKSELGMNDAEWERQVTAFNRAHRGAKKSGAVMAFQDVDFKATTHSPKDAEYLGMANRHDQEISTVMGVPTQLFKAENINRANYEAAQLQFWSDTMIPLLSMVAGQMNEFLCVRYGPDIVVEFDTSVVAALQADLAPVAARMRDGFESGTVKIDEYRNAIGLDALEDGGGQLFKRKLTDQYVATQTEYEPPPPAPPPAPLPPQAQEAPVSDEEAAPEAIPAKAMKSQQGPLVRKRARSVYGDEAHVARYKAFDERSKRREAALVQEIAAWSRQLEAEVLAKLEAGKSFTITRQVPDALLFDPRAAGNELWRIVSGATVAAMLEEGKRTIGEIAVWLPEASGLNFTVQDPAVLDFLARKELKVKTVSTDLHSQLRDMLIEGEREGRTITELTGDITGRFEDLETWQGQRIARTEIIGAQNTASGAVTDDLELQAEWVATLDDRVRDSHAGLHGTVKDPGGAFLNGLRWPGDEHGPPEETINCRCTIAALPPEDDTEVA